MSLPSQVNLAPQQRLAHSLTDSIKHRFDIIRIKCELEAKENA